MFVESDEVGGLILEQEARAIRLPKLETFMPENDRLGALLSDIDTE